MTRDLVVKPLDYSPYISIHWEDAAGGHDFKIDPPLDSPAYVAKFSQNEDQFVCGSDFRIDRTQVFGSAGVFIPNKGFRLFFYDEHYLLMGGFIGQPPIMFSGGSHSYEVFKKFPFPEDGSYFTYGRELAVKDANYLALCSSNTPSIVDLYKLDGNQSFIKVKSIDTGSTVVRLLPDRKGFYVAFADSYLFVDMSAEQEVIGKPVKALLHAVEYGIFGADICTLVLSHDKNVYYKNSTSANETLIFALKPNFDFVIQTLKGSNTRGVPNILVGVYYRSSTILCEPAYYILDREGVLTIPPSTVTYSTSAKKDVGFIIQNDNCATGPYGLYAKDTYEQCSLVHDSLNVRSNNNSWLGLAGGTNSISRNAAIAHDNYLYGVTKTSKDSQSVLQCWWQTYEKKSNDGSDTPLEVGCLSCPDHPDGYFPTEPINNKNDNDNLDHRHWFEIRNCSWFAFSKNNEGASYLFDLKDHSYKCLFNTSVPDDVNKDHPDVSPYQAKSLTHFVYDENSDSIITYEPLLNKSSLNVIRIDFFDRNKDGNFAYSASHFIDTQYKNSNSTVYSNCRVSLESVKGYGVIVALIYDGGPDVDSRIFKCTKTKHDAIAIDWMAASYYTKRIFNLRYLSKSDCFLIQWRGSSEYCIYELKNNRLNFIRTDLHITNTMSIHGDFVLGVYDRAHWASHNKIDYYDIYTTVVKVNKRSSTEITYWVKFYTKCDVTNWSSSESASVYASVYNGNYDDGWLRRTVWGTFVIYQKSKTLYPCFSPYLPFSAKESEVLDSVSIDDTVNFTNQAEQTGRHLMYKDNSLYEIKRFPAEEYYSADHVFNVSYSPSGKFVIYQNPDGMNLARRKAGGNYVNISKKSLTFVDGYNAGWDSITEKDFETHPLHTKLSNFVFGKSPLLFTYLALPATDTLEAGVPDISNGTSSDEPLSPYGRRIVRTDGKNFYRIYYDWNKNMVRSHAAFDSGEIYMASTYLRSGGAESDIVLYLIAGDKATPPDAHGYSDLNNAFTCDRKPVKFGPIDFSVCDVVVVAHGRDNDQEQPFTFFKLDRKEHTLTDMHLKIDNWDVDAPILDVKFLDCDRIVVVTPDEAILIDDDEDDDEKKKKIKDRVKLKKGGIIKEVDKGKFKVDGDGDGSGMGSGGSGFGVGKDWLKPEYIVEALSINIFYRD